MFGSNIFASLPFAATWSGTQRQILGRYATILSSRDSTTIVWSRSGNTVISETSSVTVLRS